MAFKQVMSFQHFVYVPVHVCVFLYCHIETQEMCNTVSFTVYGRKPIEYWLSLSYKNFETF